MSNQYRGMTQSFIQQMREDSGTGPFRESSLTNRQDRPLSASQKAALTAVRVKDQALADEIEKLWIKGRSYRRLLHVSDQQMARVMNGLNAAGMPLLNQIEAADKEIDAAEEASASSATSPPEPSTADVPLDEPVNPLLREDKETISTGQHMYEQMLSSLMKRQQLTEQDKANLRECCRLEAAATANRPYFRVGRRIPMQVREKKGEIRAPFAADVDPQRRGEVEIVDGDEVISTLPEVAIQIYYPLTVPYQMRLKLDQPFTREMLMTNIFVAYLRLYQQEGERPANIPGTLNRPRTNGKYGIWGHNISDLHILRVYEVEPGIFVPEMGS